MTTGWPPPCSRWATACWPRSASDPHDVPAAVPTPAPGRPCGHGNAGAARKLLGGDALAQHDDAALAHGVARPIGREVDAHQRAIGDHDVLVEDRPAHHR